MGFANTTTDLRLSDDAIAMARQLATPDGQVVFEHHPLRNTTDEWNVDVLQRSTLSHDGRFAAEPYRQLLAYGLAEIERSAEPYIERHPITNRIIRTFPWAIALTERGAAWVEGGCPLTITPPSTMKRRAA